MKRIILLVALIITVMSLSVSAEKTAHWEGFIQTPQIGQPMNHGEIGIRLQPFEFNHGEMLNNGVEGLLFFDYGVGPNTELRINLSDGKEYYGYNTLSHQNVIGSLKHKLVDQNGFSFSILGKMTYEHYPQYESHSWTPNAGLLFGKIMSKNLKVNNNVYFTFYPTGNVGVTMENGLAYVINPTNIIKARLETYMVDLNSMSNNIKVAYRTHINDQMNYTLLLEKTFGATNTHLENIIEYKPVRDLALTGNYIFNTHTSHWLQVRVDKAMTDHVTLVGQYDKQLKYNGYSSLVTGVNFTF